MQLRLILITILTMEFASAKNLGVYGPVFEIKEESLLQLIEKRLKTLKEGGKIDIHQQELARKSGEKINRPTPISGVSKAKTYTKKEYDPSFVVSKDIKDHQGRIIARRGDIYNPLDYVAFGVPLVFVDGDDGSQVQWAISQKAKIILINGAPLELEKQYNQPFYFDQGAVLTTKFGIEEVPSHVSQEDKHLIIETIPPASLKGKGK